MVAKTTPMKTAAILTDIANGFSKVETAARNGVSLRTVFRCLDTVRKEIESPKQLLPCGTNAAYRRHYRKKERCPECWEAHSKYNTSRLG